MRISIPSIPEQSSRKVIQYTVQQASERIAEFVSRANGKALIITGAGISVDSGIAPYRGENGHYTIHKTYRPLFYHEFIDESEKGHLARQRYYSRSYLGFPPVRNAKPNKGHYAISAIQRLGYVPEYITQNVDNLHHAATPSPSLAASTILELHGSFQSVVCVSTPSNLNRSSWPINQSLYETLQPTPRSQSKWSYNTTSETYPNGCGFRGSRNAFQDQLTKLNPIWHSFSLSPNTDTLKTNPDGDIQLSSNTDYSSFLYPSCPNCGGILKPSVIFFGESVPDFNKLRSFQLINNASSILLVASSLATYSAFRLVKHAVELKKPILLLNIGPTRVDFIVDDKIELSSSDVLHATAKLLSAGRENSDKLLYQLLS